jgi:hypothetical protein
LTLGRGCFQNCSSLEFVAFEWGSKLEAIGEAAFHGCRALVALYIPATVGIFHWDGGRHLRGLVKPGRMKSGSLGNDSRLFPTRNGVNEDDGEWLEGYRQLVSDLVAALAAI